VDEAGDTVAKRRGSRRLGKAALAVLLLIVVALAILWLLRFGLARRYVDAELASRGVRASYEISQIGFGTAAFEHVVIGDPQRPDLVADHVELGLALRFTGPGIGAVGARGVRMNGRLEDGRLNLGQVDALLGRPANAPFRLPDRGMELDDAALRLATRAGDLILALAGRGNLAGNFRGGLVLLAPALRLGPCRLEGVAARLSLRVQDGRPRLHGPATTARATCVGAGAERPAFAVSLLFSPGLDQWRGAARGGTPALRLEAARAAAADIHLTFEGDANRTAGHLDVALGTASAGAASAFTGGYVLSARRGSLSLDLLHGGHAVSWRWLAEPAAANP